MNKNIAYSLYEKFPLLYRSFYDPIKNVFLNEALECGDGWLDLLEQFSSDIEEQARHEGRKVSNWPEARNVKEKYGSLRIDIYGGSSVMHQMAFTLERLSVCICEECGAPGQLYDDAWIRTQCLSCRDAMYQK